MIDINSKTQPKNSISDLIVESIYILNNVMGLTKTSFLLRDDSVKAHYVDLYIKEIELKYPKSSFNKFENSLNILYMVIEDFHKFSKNLKNLIKSIKDENLVAFLLDILKVVDLQPKLIKSIQKRL